MKHTIEDLWYGNIATSENCGVNDPEIEKLVCLIERNKDKLNKVLCDPQKQLLEKLLSCSDEFTQLLSARAFCDGFCLASRLLTEALTDSI